MRSAARRPRRVPSALVASDFTLPRSRRRASSPGARSELSSRSTRRVRRRLVRSGDRLQPGRSGGGTQRLDSDADSILNALERSLNARDHAGLSTTTEHRCGSCTIACICICRHHCLVFSNYLEPSCAIVTLLCDCWLSSHCIIMKGSRQEGYQQAGSQPAALINKCVNLKPAASY